MALHITVGGVPLCQMPPQSITVRFNGGVVLCGYLEAQAAKMAAELLRLLNPDRDPETIKVVPQDCPKTGM